MPSYVVFLRAVNLGATRKVPMADLRRWLAEDGFTDVETHIQTGNVRVGTPQRSRAKVEQRFERLLADRCGFEVPAMAFTPAELRQVHEDALGMEPPAFAGAEGERRYVIFFKDAPDPSQVALDHEHGRALAAGRAAHLWVAGSIYQDKAFRALGKVLEPGTNRTLKVVTTLAGRWAP